MAGSEFHLRGSTPPPQFRTWQRLRRRNRLRAVSIVAATFAVEGGSMSNVRWLAVLPFLAILIGTAFVNSVEPIVFGMPLVLAWLVIWVLLTAAIMALIYYYDPANAEDGDGRAGR
jgi:uncharacterized protein DUF3311